MTIRYTCSNCESVLRIRDEKAGTDAKCPKCRTAFVVPDADTSPDEPAVESAADDFPVDMPVDMPFELTPEAEIPELTETPQPVIPQPEVTPPGAPPDRPTVADLMREHEAARKKVSKKAATEPAPAPEVSAGSAADMLAAYHEKRPSSKNAPKSRTEQRAEEEREVMIGFVQKRLIPGTVVAAVLIFGWYWWMTREVYEGPPLFEVTGVISVGEAPAAGVRVEFAPDNPAPDQPAMSASGITDSEGRYRLEAFAGFTGAPVGSYVVGLTGADGFPLQIPEAQVQQTVSDSAENVFDFQL